MEVSYNHLFDFVRKERASQELQEVPSELYEQARSLLSDLTMQARDAEDESAAGAVLQLANSRKLLRELYDRREQKILLLAQNKARTGSVLVDSPNLLPQEKNLLERIVQTLLDYRSGVTRVSERIERQRITIETEVTERVVQKEAPALPEEVANEELSAESDEPLVSVRFVVTVPQFYGKNMELHGPYEGGQLQDIPQSVANMLVRKGSAELMERLPEAE